MAKVSDPAVDKAAIKALVTVYGPREAARISGVKVGTVMGWSHRYKWKRAAYTGPPAKDAGDSLRDALEDSKRASTLNLAKYTEKASKAAVEHPKPLEVARKVRDVAGVYSTLWPAEAESELIEGAILLGQAQVLDDPEAMKRVSDADQGVRERISDSGSSGD